MNQFTLFRLLQAIGLFSAPHDIQKVNRQNLSSDRAAVPFASEFHFMVKPLERLAAPATGDETIDLFSIVDRQPFFGFPSQFGPVADRYPVFFGFMHENIAGPDLGGSMGLTFPNPLDGFINDGTLFYERAFWGDGAATPIFQNQSSRIFHVDDGAGNGWELEAPGAGFFQDLANNPNRLTVTWTKLGAGLSVRALLIILGVRTTSLIP